MVASNNSSSKFTVRNLFSVPVSDLSDGSSPSRRLLLFGILPQMLAFILLLIGIGYGISALKVKTFNEYTVDREKVDLRDEGENKKLKIELSLECAYGQIVDLLKKEKSSDELVTVQKEFPLATQGRDQNIQTAWVVGEIRGEQSRKAPELIEHRFNENVLRSHCAAKQKHPLWSPTYWHSEPRNNKKDPFPCINVVVPNESNDNDYWLVRFDLTPMAKETLRGARQLQYFVGADCYESTDESNKKVVKKSGGQSEHKTDSNFHLWLAPNDLPKPGGSLDRRQPPEAVVEAIVDFKNAYEKNEKNKQILLRGSLWPPEEEAAKSLQTRIGRLFSSQHGVPWTSMRGNKSSAPTELFYLQSEELDKRVLNALLALEPTHAADSSVSQRDEKTKDNSIGTQCTEFLHSQDSYIKVDPITQKVKRIRIRASSLESLELAQNYCQLVVRNLGRKSTTDRGEQLPELSQPIDFSDVSLKWNKEIRLDNYVVCVQRVELPLGGKKFEDKEKPYLGYVLLAASLDEIRGAVTQDLGYLEYLTLGAIAFAICSAFFVSSRLISPLSRMTMIAQDVAKISRSSNRSSDELEALLSKLPTDLSNEIGILSKQFDLTTRELIRSKRKAEEDAEHIASKQREVEQAERERAVANEVSGHLVQLLGSVSHDMRQPLLLISTQADQLSKRSDSTDAHREKLRKILRGACELDSLINDILDYKRFINGNITLAVVEFEVEHLIEEIETQHEETAAKRNVKIITDLWWRGQLNSDRMRLKRVINNLVANAISATNNGEVHIQVTPNGADWIEISIRDTGCGMNAAQQELVFKFGDERAKALRRQGAIGSRKDANSTGLGLFISKQLIECMGGSIQFESVEGKGSKFTVRLPVRVPINSSQPESKLNLSQTVATLSANNTNSTIAFPSKERTVVVVDDDPKCTEILAEMLAELGYRATHVHDPRTAVGIINEMHPDLVTLDILMPQIDGWEVLRQLKQNPATGDIPVIMVTVHPDEEKATVLGADAFVSKPVEEPSLRQAINLAIGSRRDASVLVVDDDVDCLKEMLGLLEPLGCRVLTARDGVEALDCLRTLPCNSPNGKILDLVIVDLFMPNMDGFALIERLGAMPETRQVPIIVLSAAVYTNEERKKLLPHVKNFFGKGTVDFGTLREEIRRLLNRPVIESQTSEPIVLKK